MARRETEEGGTVRAVSVYEAREARVHEEAAKIE
jgi:hypothetical protein